MGKMVDRQVTFTKNVALLIEYCRVCEVNLTFGDAYRSEEQQKIYVDKGLSKTMNSKHRSRLAVDFNFFVDGKLTYEKNTLQHVGDYWESLDDNNKWGGNWTFVDVPHFQG